jgi:hypothetical protein
MENEESVEQSNRRIEGRAPHPAQEAFTIPDVLFPIPAAEQRAQKNATRAPGVAVPRAIPNLGDGSAHVARSAGVSAGHLVR